MSASDRTDLATLAASLHAYLEWQESTGAVGFPRGARPHATEGVARADGAPREERAAIGPPAARAATSGVPVGPPAAHAPPRSAAETPSAAAAAPSDPPSAVARVRLPQLAAEVAACTRCGLASSRTQTVFARGNPEAALCFVGEAPGADEDAQGLPFVGRAGQLLDRMIAAMGLSPEDGVYVCNIIKCRPPGNRRPEPIEMSTCIPYLHEQLSLVRPRVIVALGNTAVAALLDTKMGITKIRGEWKLYRGQTLVMPTYHPSYLLRPSPQQIEAKRQAWHDLQLVMKELGLSPPQRP